MDKKVFLAMSLCAGIFLLWQNLYLKPYTERQQALVAQQSQMQQQTKNPSTETVLKTELTNTKTSTQVGTTSDKRFIALGDEGYKVTIATQGGTVSNIEIGNYRGQKTEHVNLLVGGKDQLEVTTPSQDWAYLSNVVYSVVKSDRNQLVLEYKDANVSVQRNYTLNSQNFYLDSTISAQFSKPAPGYVFVNLKALRNVPKEKAENERRNIYFNRSGGQKSWQVSDVDEVKEDLGEGNWAAVSSRYFLSALVDNGAAVKPQFQTRPLDQETLTASLIYKTQGQSLNIPVRFYYGPKETDLLKSVGKHLDASVDFGWFTIFAYPLLKALKWFYGYVHNFGIAIILLTVLVKLLTYPLTFKSMKSMKEMQRIQPQLARLREKHKDDKEKLNREMLQLMRANGYNPMSGCLPVFIQMPIFVALYNVLYGAIDLYGQPFFGWIHDLSAKDPFYVTPALLALMMFVQQKLTPNTATDPAQQKMMMIMPLVFGLMMLWLPSGLTLYMLVNSVVSILQQLFINRNLRPGATSGVTVTA